ncbi:MAG: EamA family transporter [Hyphomonadaceae bacterium]|nr:EamA family transporter [Hyphomonadaceae bacterium]
MHNEKVCLGALWVNVLRAAKGALTALFTTFAKAMSQNGATGARRAATSRAGPMITNTQDQQSARAFDLASIAICTLAWGTTWFAITQQFGVVDPIVSIVYRFALASALLFAWCLARNEPIAMTRPQHASAFGMGLFNFAINYALVYWAEERVTSAVVAVVFAALAFVNLAMFRVVFAQRASLLAWVAAGLGVAGVGLMSWEELAAANMDARALTGIAMTFGAVVAASVANVFARRGEMAGSAVAPMTAWAMLYGTAQIALYAIVTGRVWAFEATLPYIASLLHLSVVGSVLAFLLYYGLARRRGYATASYISALTPPVAMLVSALFEGKSWGLLALGGVGLVLAGQALLLRSRRA